MVKLLQGETLDEMAKLPDKSVDMILCDLPYGTTANDWDKVIPFDKLWNHYERLIKDNGAIVLFGQGLFANELISSNKRLYRYKWIWKKARAVGFLNSHKMPLRVVEEILVFYKKLPTYNPQMRKGFKPYFNRKKASLSRNYKAHGGAESKSNGERFPIDILEYAQPSVAGKGMHPTQKPVDLLEYLIKTYTNPGDVILDNTMGSGSTGVAALNLNRDFIGIELDKHYYEIAKKRIEKGLIMFGG